MECMLLGFLILSSAALTPLIAGAMVLLAAEKTGSRLGAWLGLSIGLGMASTVPLYSLLVSISGPAFSPVYAYAVLFGAYALVLGLWLVRLHERRLRDGRTQSPGTAAACVVFAGAVAIALSPWLTGAPLPVGGGWFGMETPVPGDLRAYLALVLPLSIGMAFEALTLGGRSPGETARNGEGL